MYAASMKEVSVILTFLINERSRFKDGSIHMGLGGGGWGPFRLRRIARGAGRSFHPSFLLQS